MIESAKLIQFTGREFVSSQSIFLYLSYFRVEATTFHKIAGINVAGITLSIILIL